MLPPGGWLFLSPDIKAFRARTASPKAGEAAFVLQVPDGLLPPADGSGASWSARDEAGTAVRLVSA